MGSIMVVGTILVFSLVSIVLVLKKLSKEISKEPPAKELPIGEYIKVNGRYYMSGTPYMKDKSIEVIDDYGVKWKVDKMLFNDTRN